MIIEKLKEIIDPTPEFSSTTTDIFFWVILSVFIAALILRLRGKKPAFTDYIPTLLSSLGILGTFAGIVIGLLAFDPTPEKMNDSITNLLWGLQTAFFTSITGVFLSITFKAFESFLLNQEQASENSDGLAQSDNSIEGILTVQNQHLAQIVKSIGDENTDSSLVNILKLHRSDAADQRKQVINALQTLNDAMGQQHQVHIETQALVQQLMQQQSTFAAQLWLGNCSRSSPLKRQ